MSDDQVAPLYCGDHRKLEAGIRECICGVIGVVARGIRTTARLRLNKDIKVHQVNKQGMRATKSGARNRGEGLGRYHQATGAADNGFSASWPDATISSGVLAFTW